MALGVAVSGLEPEGQNALPQWLVCGTLQLVWTVLTVLAAPQSAGMMLLLCSCLPAAGHPLRANCPESAITA